MSRMTKTNCKHIYGGEVACTMRGWTRKHPDNYICKKHWKDSKSKVVHPKRSKHKASSQQSQNKKKKKG